MTPASVSHRRIYMHAAHPIVGVSNSSAFFQALRAQERFSLSAKQTTPTVTLVSGELSSRNATLLLGLQRIFQKRLNAECRCSFIDLAEGVGELGEIEASDCTVLLHQGITILHDRASWNPDRLCDDCLEVPVPGNAEISLKPDGLHHAVLEEVSPFSTHSIPMSPQELPAQSVCLMWAQVGTTRWPVAWAHETNGCRQFHTSLGSNEDFRQPSFCRMLTNAVAWTSDNAGD